MIIGCEGKMLERMKEKSAMLGVRMGASVPKSSPRLLL